MEFIHDFMHGWFLDSLDVNPQEETKNRACQNGSLSVMRPQLGIIKGRIKNEYF